MASRHRASFRDPSGFLFEHEGRLYRQVNPGFAAEYDQLMSGGLYRRLVAEGSLVPHEEVELRLADLGPAHRVLAPERVPFVSYPYEWCFGALRAAALLTLELMRTALDHGMVLRDASAYNVQFIGAKPTFIDTLSFGRYVDGEPWLAYRQFCQHFLAPLALQSRVDVRLSQLLRIHLDGIPLNLASALLPWRTWLRPSLFAHVHLHARTLRRHSDTTQGSSSSERARSATVSKNGLLGLLDNLSSAVSALSWEPVGSEWADYYRGTNYSEAAEAQKTELVAGMLREVNPQVVWDLGANNGRFARLAVANGARTVAFDVDPSAVEQGWRTSRDKAETRLLHLVQDLTNPSPGLGWANAERDPTTGRGPADLLLALALIHHLAIGNNVPLVQISAYLATIGRHLVIEFVPKEDSQVKRLLSAREDVFPDYHRDGFEAAFAHHWRIARREPVADSLRTMYRMELAA